MNGWLTGEIFRDEAQKTISSTTYVPNLLGAPCEQTTRARNLIGDKEGTEGYDDHVRTNYVAYDTGIWCKNLIDPILLGG